MSSYLSIFCIEDNKFLTDSSIELKKIKIQPTNSKIIKISESSLKKVEPSTSFIKTSEAKTVKHGEIESKEKKEDSYINKVKSFSPIFYEQLILFDSLCNEKGREYCLEDVLLVKEFASIIVKKSKYSLKDRSEWELSLFGKLIHAVNTDLKSTIELIKKSRDFDIICREIDKKFQNDLDLIFQRIQKHVKEHSDVDLQNKDSAFIVSLSIELAKILITDNGILNRLIIDELHKKFFSSSSETFYSYQTHFCNVLKELVTSPELRKVLESITKPTELTAPANLIIRITLGLSSEVIISDTDAKKTALSALFAHMRQGKIGSCFASYLAIQKLSNHFEESLIDFKHLLEESKLCRVFEKKVLYFPYILRTSSISADPFARVDITGNIANLNAYVWDSPGLKAASKIMGIKNSKLVLLRILPIFFSISEKYKNISIKELLKRMILFASTHQFEIEEPSSILFEKGLLAFEGQTHHLLQRMWENSIAGMSEISEKGINRRSIIKSITVPIQNTLELWDSSRKELWEKFTIIISTVAFEKMRLQYTPDRYNFDSINNESEAKDAFLLYDNRESIHPKDWKWINNERAFLEFTESVLKKSFNVFHEKIRLDPKHLSEIDKIFEKLVRHVNNDRFLESIIRIYNKDFNPDPDIIKNINLINSTPWKGLKGKNSTQTAFIYSLGRVPFDQKIILPINSQDLFLKLINLGRSFSKQRNKEILQGQHKLTPLVISGLHSLSLIFGHSSFKKYWASEKNGLEWLNDHILGHGMEVANGIISFETRKKMIDFSASSFISQKEIEIFKKEATSIIDPLSVKEFRTILLSLIEKFPLQTEILAKNIASKLDKFLCTSALPEHEKKLFKNSIIHFADTNWGRGLNDYHLCFLINPGTGKFEIWKILDDESIFIPLDQNKWIQKRTWKVLL